LGRYATLEADLRQAPPQFAVELHLLAEDALCVDLEQHVNAVAGPLGHLCWWDSGVQPGRHRSVPEVVRPSGKWRSRLRPCQRAVTRLSPRTTVYRLREWSAARRPEQASVRPSAELRYVLLQQGGERRWYWNESHVVIAAMLELAAASRPVVGPLTRRRWVRTAERLRPSPRSAIVGPRR
jgi:hypothetical protein